MESSMLVDFLFNHWSSVALAATTFVLFLYFRQNTPGNLPPGPFSLPIVGTLPFLGLDIREPLRRLSRKYGDIFTVYFGARRVIILNSYDAIKEAFVKLNQGMSGRPQDFFWVKEITEGKGIVSTQGEGWKEQRKFSHSVLREMGVGTTLMEDKITEEVFYFRKALEEISSAPCDPSYTIQCAVANIIHSVIFGYRRKYDDQEFLEYIEIMNANFEVLGNAGALITFPSLRYLPGDFFQYHQLMRTSKYMKDQFRKEIAEGRERYKNAEDASEGSRDYIEAYLKIIDEHKEKGIKSSFNEEQLVGVIGDLFGAGTETTTSTLRWGLVYLLHYPEVQAKVQAEIDDIIGTERLPRMSDRSQMPYTEACLHELQRAADIVPLGVPHCTTEDVEIQGYTIPEGTTVMSHLYAVHRDPKLWPEPDKFDPTRFLDSDGKLNRHETLIPFSMGKRVCLGESLARMEMFLMFTGLLQHFTFSQPPGEELPPTIGTLSITHMPKSFKVQITKR